MEKKIRDYLHLYLGCEMIDLHQLPNQIEPLTAESLHIARLSDNKWYKPILRPLSDMTEEEAIEVAGLSEWEGHFRDVKVERNKFNDLIVSWDGITECGETFNSTGELFYCSDQFIYLLSKQFDLFELIEYGLAIDKTKLPAHA